MFQAIGYMKTTRTRTSKNARRVAILIAPCIINLIACFAFVATREPATELIKEREEARRVGAFTLSSADPYMIIAERPLRNWSRWHGGESTWVKVAEVLNGPALLLTKRIGDWWAWRATNSYERESWTRAYVFIILSSLQWLALGAIAAKIVARRDRAPDAASPAAQIENSMNR